MNVRDGLQEEERMNQKKIMAAAAAVCVLMNVTPVWAAAPEALQFEEEAHLIPGIGETWDAAEELEITGSEGKDGIVYSAFDDAVASVSGDGVVTANGCGTTTIVAASAEDETISTSIDVTVFDFYGMYSGVKTVEAMGCDIAIDLTLNEDGTCFYYRAPMNVSLSGGGEMPALEDEGTWTMTGTTIAITGKELGEFTAEFSLSDNDGVLKGKFPTGGAQTEMELIKQADEENTEQEASEVQTETEDAAGTAERSTEKK